MPWTSTNHSSPASKKGVAGFDPAAAGSSLAFERRLTDMISLRLAMRVIASGSSLGEVVCLADPVAGRLAAALFASPVLGRRLSRKTLPHFLHVNRRVLPNGTFASEIE